MDKMIQYQEESQRVISVALYDRAECKAIVEQVKSLNGWTAAQVREAKDRVNFESLTQPEVRSASILASDEAEELYRQFDARVNATLKPLINQIWRIDLANHSGTQILRYGPADHYVPHQDTGPDFEDRYLSVVCYLNDDFAGGQTSFPGFDYATTPEAGKAIVFPSGYLHGSEPVISGEKFVVVSWVNGPIPINWI
jgi:predicted 2-oxoglutarate/Fe(II)-dependent dioxygenase YbiX